MILKIQQPCLFSISLCAQLDKELINKFITENQNGIKFDSISEVLGYKGGDKVRVSTLFSVNEKGNLTDIVARGPHEIFEDEAIRILKMVPKLDPAMVNGKPVIPRFALPITFVIETERQKKKRAKREKD